MLSLVAGSLALIPAALAIAAWGALPRVTVFVLAHMAAAGFAVCVGAADFCAHRTTGLLGKNDRGRMEAWGLVLMWPFHLGLRIRLHWKRSNSREPIYNEILPGWYLGGWPPNASSMPPGSPAVLDVTCEFPRTQSGKEYLCLPTWDTHAPVVPQIDQGVEWALERHKAGRGVYVHCAHGHGRSVLVLCACFIKGKFAADGNEAIEIIKMRRPKARLNKRQNAALQAWILKHQEEGAQVRTK
ncbi:unnamed protein product [Ostreobium quekettii]|uniref:Tyrosine specific protein phosphatases domain-containing protein n=1 Tax=Ostreobium quekettii TaxID=121088 RepID=A0A8S1J8L0_9CHLO|nr:unnamed protein product [Ostreobium quekettii]|eukprot:evm.model.scf_972.1 EVM.evm.TU.scf_972.1   scf_972:1948-3787(+)